MRDAVTARYENSPSYREYLAAEAERALEQAQAEAEVATRNARAVAEAQFQLLEELDQWQQAERSPREQAFEQVRSEARGELAHALADIALGARELMDEPAHTAAQYGSRKGGWKDTKANAVTPLSPRVTITEADAPLTEVSAGGLTIKLYNGLDAKLTASTPKAAELKPNRRRDTLAAEPDEMSELDAEIGWRHDLTTAAPHIVETTPIPANLIEFPRQLIAPRRVRPRLAEGPLREDAPAEPQLRIFEVEPEQVATEVVAAEPVFSSGWQELFLESANVPAYVPPAEAQTQFTLQPQIAPVRPRLAATAVDLGCLPLALGCFREAALHLGGAAFHNAPKPLLGAAFGASLLLFYTLYQVLFFTVSDGTPGMRAARIALCTFGDDNPSRKAMRRRVFHTLLAACPLGVGLLWSLLDGEGLGWHDRMSRMYQRAY